MNQISTEEFVSYLKRAQIPPHPPATTSPSEYGFREDFRLSYDTRLNVTREYGMWAIVDQVWTKALAEWVGQRYCLEVMAGKGWLAKALSDHGIHVLATDNGEWKHTQCQMDPVYPVLLMDGVEAVEHSPNADVLIVSWPPYGEDYVCRIAEAWGPERPLVYIGEENGGANAPDEFFEHFLKLDPHPNIPLMSWSGIHDEVMIGRYLAQSRRHNEEDTE